MVRVGVLDWVLKVSGSRHIVCSEHIGSTVQDASPVPVQ